MCQINAELAVGGVAPVEVRERGVAGGGQGGTRAP